MVSQATFGEPWLEANPQRVQLSKPAFAIYGHPDLQKAHKFLIEFGLHEVSRSSDGKTVSYGGYGTQPVSYVAKQTPAPEYFGYFFEARSRAELDKAAAVPGAGPIYDLDLPGGGQAVTITTPSGFPFGVVHGQQSKAPGKPLDDVLPFNWPAESDLDDAKKPRRGKFQRLEHGPVPVHKLGHSGYWVSDLESNARFFMKHFNFKPSDIMLDREGSDGRANLIFFHVDLGSDYSDHHSLILGQAFGPIPPGPHHAAFEIDSIDHQFVGHDFLAEQGYKDFWGVGRHIEGSQVFDYWWDVDGFLMEHYVDGDLVNRDNPVNWVPPRARGSNWGPAFPKLDSLPPPPREVPAAVS